jgi:predicted kinase
MADGFGGDSTTATGRVGNVATLVIVCGAPASGKTVLAQSLGANLGMPVIGKDLLKEAMMDHVGNAPGVGAASFAVQLAVARQLLESGVNIVLEGAFFRSQSEVAELANLADTFVIELDCPIEVLEQRYLTRQPSRHPGHRGAEALPDLRRRVAEGEYGIPDLNRPTLRVDSTDGFKPSEKDVVGWIRQQA